MTEHNTGKKKKYHRYKKQKPKFKGKEQESVKGYIFVDYSGGKSPDQWIKTSKEIQGFVGRTATKFNKEFTTAVKELELIDPNPPERPNSTNPFDIHEYGQRFKDHQALLQVISDFRRSKLYASDTSTRESNMVVLKYWQRQAFLASLEKAGVPLDVWNCLQHLVDNDLATASNRYLEMARKETLRAIDNFHMRSFTSGAIPFGQESHMKGILQSVILRTSLSANSHACSTESSKSGCLPVTAIFNHGNYSYIVRSTVAASKYWCLE